MTAGSVLDAILPAGGRIDGPLAAEAGTDLKALIPLGGSTVLARTLSALRQTGRMGRILIVGPKELARNQATQAADAVLSDTGSPAGNILAGLDWLRDAGGGQADRVLVMTTDLPFVTPAAVSALLEACPAQPDVCLPVIRRDEFEARFPRAPRRYARLRDGEWVIAGAGTANPLALQQNRGRVERAYAARRNFVALSLLLGPRFLLRCLLRQAGVADIARRCGEILHCSCCAVRSCPPELAYDIDYDQDYRYAVEYLNGRSMPTA